MQIKTKSKGTLTKKKERGREGGREGRKKEGPNDFYVKENLALKEKY